MVVLLAALATVAGVRAGVLSTGPYAQDTGADVLQRVWADDLGDVPWTVGVRMASGTPEILRRDGGSDAPVVVLADEDAVLLHEYRLNAQASPQRPDLYVATACGRSRGMPSRTPAGVPVAFPCRDGTVVLGEDGLYADGSP